MNETPPEPNGFPEAEAELCPQCLTDNPPGAHFYRHCGAPLTSYAATAPFESVFAAGRLYQRSTEQPRRLIVVVGVWLIFAPMALAGLVVIPLALGKDDDLFFSIAAFEVGLLAAFLIGRTTCRYFRRRRKPPPAPPA